MATPFITKYWNLIINGKGNYGEVTMTKLPDLKLKTEEYRAGGMDMPIDVDMGMEKLTMSFSIPGPKEDIYSYFGLQDGQAVHLSFRGALVNQTTRAYEKVECRGMLTSIVRDNLEAGKMSNVTFEASLRYYEYALGDKIIHQFDADNMVRIVNGIDQLVDIKNALGI